MAALAAAFIPSQLAMAKDDVATPRTAHGPSLTQPDAPVALDDSGKADSKRRTLGTIFGVILLLLCILYWSDGLGALGLRSGLAARLQERTDAYRAEQGRLAEEASDQPDTSA
jgi:hypothetical protein